MLKKKKYFFKEVEIIETLLIALKLCLVVDEKWPKNVWSLVNGIEFMLDNTWKWINMYFGSDWWWFLGVSSKTIDTVTFNMLLHDGKLFFKNAKRSQTHLLMRFNGIEIMLGYK